jgi:glucose/arabinose dehydrogenase
MLVFCLAPAVLISQPRAAGAQDLLNDNPSYSDFNLELRVFATLPASSKNIISMTTRRGDPRLCVSTQEGQIHILEPNETGSATPALWFDVASAESSLGHPLHGNSSQSGLQSVAFHPDFERADTPGYGKLYTTMLETRPANAQGHFYLGSSVPAPGIAADGVVAEWTFDHQAGAVIVNSYRELFRVNMPLYDHPIKQARFNPYSNPGDDDYGLLYITHGDSNLKPSSNNDPQRLDNALGKIRRIDPLQSGADRYSIPASNPFADSTDPGVLNEIYAYGLRNPHTFSFNKDAEGNVHILAGDIGRDNVEEINRIVAGGNYGWPKREGTFAHLQVPENDPAAGYITGVGPLAPDEASQGITFPVAQFDHNAMFSQIASGNAIASGFVLRNASDPRLRNQLIFNNFAFHDGIVYHADFDEMLDAIDHLVEGDPNRDEPAELAQSVLHKLRLSLDHDNDADTPPQVHDDFHQLLSWPRSDTRYGEGALGEMYISSKIDGTIYLVTNSLPLAGDYNRDGAVDAADYTIWRRSLGDNGYQLAADGNGNGEIDVSDYTVWHTHFGVSLISGIGIAQAAKGAVPEPTDLVLFAVALSATLIRRHSVSRLSSNRPPELGPQDDRPAREAIDAQALAMGTTEFQKLLLHLRPCCRHTQFLDTPRRHAFPGVNSSSFI